MWVETSNGKLINLARYERVFASGYAVTAENYTITSDGDDRECLFEATNHDESKAALRRIRDALAEGRTYLSLRDETKQYNNLDRGWLLEKLIKGQTLHYSTHSHAKAVVDVASEFGFEAELGVHDESDGGAFYVRLMQP